MTCKEQWAELRLSMSDDILLVLDASESAEDYRQDILDLVCQLLHSLPATSKIQLAFLGSPTRYAPEEILHSGADLWSANLGRCSVLHPVFPCGETDWEGRIVIVGTGPVYDLPDWGGSLRDRLVLVSVGQPLSDSDRHGTIVATRQASDVSGLLSVPIDGVVVSGPGILPFCWDNGAYQLESEEGTAWLRLEGETHMDVVVGYLGPPGLPTARVTFSDGSQETVSLNAHEPDVRDLICVRLLTVEESVGFYREPSRRAAWWESTGRPVFRSAVSGDVGFVVVVESPEGLRGYAYPSNVLPLGKGRAGVSCPEGIVLLELDERSNRWMDISGDALACYQSIGGGIHVATM